MRRLLSRLAWLAAIGIALMPAAAIALDAPPVPTDIPIVDQANVLSPEQEAGLANLIATERSASGNQIGILTVPSLGNETIEAYSIKVARAWGIGEESRDNGVLLLVSIQDRQMRIEVGYGLEGALTDAQTNRIIRNDIAPLFQQEKYYEGIQAGVTGIIQSIHNEYVAQPESNSQKNYTSFGEGAFWLILVGPIWLSSIMARTKSWWLGGVIGAIAGIVIGAIFGFVAIGLISIAGLALLGLLFDWGVSRNFQNRRSSGMAPSWWAGGTRIGGGGSSGGGFGGFGGGGFGGGGSSGDW